MDKTIAAISTPSGIGGIGVIRISGKNALKIADSVFTSYSKKELAQLDGYRAVYGRISDSGGKKIDDAVALVFKAPHSYTGEDVVELSCHGGIFTTRAVLSAVIEAGAEISPPGEFTKRAFLNGKMSLNESEAVIDLINARSEAAAKAALTSKSGALSNRINEIKSVLTEQASHLAAWADYPDEDIEAVESDMLFSALNTVEEKLQKLLNTFKSGKILKDGIDTVIAGKPNVGKSSLMNLISGFDKSIVTEIPGTTRDIIEETVKLGDVILNICDTAGIRDTDDPVEKIGVDKAFGRLKTASLLLAVFDASATLSAEDYQLIEAVDPSACIAVVNKADLPSEIDVQYINNKFKHIVYISAVTGEGLDELSTAVAEVTGIACFDPSDAAVSTERQYTDIAAALSSVTSAISALSSGYTLDAVTVLIEEALSCLLRITGENATDVILHEVFSKFCVGK